MSAKSFVIRDPDYVARIKDNLNRQGFLHHIGARIEEVAPGRCVLAIDHRRELAQQNGFFHGGLIGTLADMAGACAAATLLEAGQSLLTAEYKINFLAPATAPVLRAVGEVARAGRTLTVSQVSLYGIEADGSEQLCALATATLMTLNGPATGR